MTKKKMFKDLIDTVKEQDCLAYENINKSLQQSSMIAEKVDSFFVTLEDLDVKVLDDRKYLSDKVKKGIGEAVEWSAKTLNE
jgi:RNA polymerase primary sigma factor